MDLVTCAALTTLCGNISTTKLYFPIISVHPLLTFLILYLSLKFYRLTIYPNYLSPLRNLPGPKDGLFLLGQAYNMAMSPPAELYISWMRRWPDAPLIRFLDVGHQEVAMLNSVKATKDVLQTNCYSFVKPAFLHRVLGEITGTGLLFAEGDAHKKQRRLLTGPFSHGNIKELLPFFVSKARELCSCIDREAMKQPQTPLEISSLLTKTTLDAIGLAALGTNFNNLSKPTELSLAFEGVFGNERSTLSTVMSVLNVYLPIRRLLPIKVNRDYLNANREIRNQVRQQIRRRKLELKEHGESSKDAKDLLAVMIRERSGGDNPWTEDEMLNHLLNFMSAGHETTAGTLTLTLYLLADHPKIQSRLRKEILYAIPSTEDLTYGAIDSLAYLHNVGREVLRLYPPAILSHREAAKDVLVDGTVIPKGTVVHVVPAAIHYNTHIWGPTAAHFDPDRWESLPKTALDPFAAGSFSNGPRICIGKAFGLLEFKIYLVELLRMFEFTGDGQPLQMQRGGPSLRPQGGLWLTPRRLERA